MSLTEYIGAVGNNILVPSESHCKMVKLNYPILSNTQLDTCVIFVTKISIR